MSQRSARKPPAKFGSRLKTMRERRGLTQRDLAARVQISPTYLEKIEQGYNSPPSTSVIRALAKSLNNDGDELFALAGKIPPDVERDLICLPLLVQLVRVGTGWTSDRLKAFLQEQGIAEEKLSFESGLTRWDIEDERLCTREPITAEMRKAIFAKDNHECVYCEARSILEVDHIYPVSLGGTNEMENLITCCHRCNKKKGNRVAPFPMVFGRFRCQVESIAAS